MIQLATDQRQGGGLELTNAELSRARDVLRTIDPLTAQRLVTLLRDSEILGNPRLLRSLFVQAWSGSISVVSGVASYGAYFDEGRENQHRFYVPPSATTTSSGRTLVCEGTQIVGSDVSIWIERSYIASPIQLRTRVAAYTTGANLTVDVKVYRIAGLT